MLFIKGARGQKPPDEAFMLAPPPFQNYPGENPALYNSHNTDTQKTHSIMYAIL